MFSPKCKSEYQEGVVIGCDWNVPLVFALQREPKMRFADFEEILSTNNGADRPIIKLQFDSEAIFYYFLGEHFTFPVRLMVIKNQVEEAGELLKDLNPSSFENDSAGV